MWVVGVGGCHLVNFLVAFQRGQLGLWVSFLYMIDFGEFSEVQRVDHVRHIQSFYNSMHCQSDIDALVGMTADMEITWNFLNSELTNKSTSVSIFEGFLSHLILFHLVRFSQQLKISGVNVSSCCIKSVFFNWTNIGMMWHHDILQIQGNYLTWETREFNIDVDPKTLDICTLVISEWRVHPNLCWLLEGHWKNDWSPILWRMQSTRQLLLKWILQDLFLQTDLEELFWRYQVFWIFAFSIIIRIIKNSLGYW